MKYYFLIFSIFSSLIFELSFDFTDDRLPVNVNEITEECEEINLKNVSDITQQLQCNGDSNGEITVKNDGTSSDVVIRWFKSNSLLSSFNDEFTIRGLKAGSYRVEMSHGTRRSRYRL